MNEVCLFAKLTVFGFLPVLAIDVINIRRKFFSNVKTRFYGNFLKASVNVKYFNTVHIDLTILIHDQQASAFLPFVGC